MTTPTGDALEARPQPAYGPVGYRWVVLGAAMGVNAVIQALWISYAPVSAAAQNFYGASEAEIGALSMVFMVAFIPLSLPASWFIDTYGAKAAVGFGSVLAAVGGLWRGLDGMPYAWVMVFTLLIAAAQPLLVNAWTAIAAAWFDQRSRALAVSLLTLSNVLGTALALAVAPTMVREWGIGGMQLFLGALMAVTAGLFVALARNRPPRPPDRDADFERTRMTYGLRHAVRLPAFRVLLVAVVVLMGSFNGVLTWVERILAPRGFSSDDAGLFGAVMLLSGIVGALVLAGLSDRHVRRVRYLTIAAVGAVPGLVGLVLAPDLPLLLAAGVVLGFFLTGALPIGMQYAAEISRPTPEGTSNGLLQLAGQGSVVLVALMEVARPDGSSFTPALVALAVGMALAAVAISRLPEPAHTPLDRRR